YVQCPVEECEKRDVKGLYKKARAGEIKEFTGISAPYEEPLSPELVLDTARETLQEASERVVKHLADRGIIRQKG
ncbi:MAG: adenylyl-sulfate kinase, partial [Eubacteriales bacterium]